MASSAIAKYVPEWYERKGDWDFVVDELENGSKLTHMFYQIVLLTPQGTEQSAEQNLLGFILPWDGSYQKVPICLCMRCWRLYRWGLAGIFTVL